MIAPPTMLGMEPSAFCMLGKYSLAEPHAVPIKTSNFSVANYVKVVLIFSSLDLFAQSLSPPSRM